MRRYLLLPLLGLSSCLLFIGGQAAVPCDPNNFTIRCDGNSLVTCQQNFEISTSCGASLCSADRQVCGFCGDGNTDPGEACDDGNQVNGDGCDNNCTLPACGNGEVDPGELCYVVPSAFP